VKRSDLVRIEYIRPGKEVTYYEENFVSRDEICLRTFKQLSQEISTALSLSLIEQKLIEPGNLVGTVSKSYFFTEPFNVLVFRDANGALLGYYSDIGEPAIQISPDKIRMTDLFLDIWMYPDGQLLELDWDEFEEAIRNQVITPPQVELARTTLKRLVSEKEQGIYPHRYL
jgi:hypothetical protein